MRILLAGDLVGEPGRAQFAKIAGRMRQAGEVDFVVANAENAAAGKGITPKIGDQLFAAGADVITMGDHTWDRKEGVPYIARTERILRPLNFAPGCPGRGFVTLTTPMGQKLTVVSLIGRVFMGNKPYDCPYRAIDALLERKDLGPIIIVDLHAEATSEKIVMGHHLDGRASIVVGTHTHVQTSDEQILPHGTAYLTDLGMVGPTHSALGRTLDSVKVAMMTGMPTEFTVGDGAPVFEGLWVEVNDQTGRAIRLRRIREQ